MFVEVVLIRLTKEIRTSELGTMFLQVSVVAVNQLNKYEVLIAGAKVHFFFLLLFLHFYFGLIEGFEPKTCNVKVKERKEEERKKNFR